MVLERRPVDLMRAKATRLQTQVSSYGKLNSLFSSLQDASNKLAGNAVWARTVAASSDDGAVMASGGSGAAAGRHAVSVQAQAGSQTLASATAEASADALAGSGSLTLELGRWGGTAFSPKAGASAVTVAIAATDTLATSRDRINAFGKVTASPVDVAVQNDIEGAKAAITAFATAYSDLARYIAEQTECDPASKVGGPLQGDSAVGRLQQQMRAVLNASSGASARYPRLSDIGLELQHEGTLSIDAAKLDAALTNPVELRQAFANRDEIVPANNGFARRYADLATQVLGMDGSLTTRTEGLRQRISRNGEQQDRLSDRVERFQQRLVAQYTAMDANLARLNALSGYVTQQLAALTPSSNNDN